MNKPMYTLTSIIPKEKEGLYTIEWVERDGRKNKDFCSYENLKDFVRILKQAGDNTELIEFKVAAIEKLLGIKPKKSKKKEGKNGSKTGKQGDTQGKG